MSKRYLQSDLRFGITDAMIEAVKNVINPKSNKSIDGEESGSEEEKDEKPKINRMKKAEHMNEAGRYADKFKKTARKGYDDSRKSHPPLSDKQKKIARLAGNPNEIDADDFKELRSKNEEVELDELSKDTLKSYVKKSDKEKKGFQKFLRTNPLADGMSPEGEKHFAKRKKYNDIAKTKIGEEVEFSEAEIARIEAIAKSI